MESPYLTKTIAKPLTLCLQELVEVKPNDPIEWIAYWLYNYIDTQLYFQEKAAFLKELQATQKRLAEAAKAREVRLKCVSSKVQQLKSLSDEGEEAVRQFWVTEVEEEEEDRGTLETGSGKHDRKITVHDSASAAKTATWKLNCQWGLICEHPVLGDMEPRPPLVYPETPEWWERQGYLLETLYDHEVYTRDNDDELPGWDEIEHMSYKDFVHEGPWLSEGALRNMQPSLVNVYKMPAKFVKHKHVPRDDDKTFPDSET